MKTSFIVKFSAAIFLSVAFLQSQSVFAQSLPPREILPPTGNNTNREDPRLEPIPILPQGLPSPSGSLPRGIIVRSRENFQIALAKGEDYLKGKNPNYKEAVLWLKNAIENNPQSKKAFLLLGLAYNSQGLFEDAISAYYQALTLDEKSAEALVGLGAANFNLKSYGAAIGYYRKALEINQKNFTAQIMLANSYFMLKDFKQAAGGYQSALRIDSNSVEANFNLALCYLSLNNRDGALKQNEIIKKLSFPVSEKLEKILNK